jgi:hypothetical protein
MPKAKFKSLYVASFILPLCDNDGRPTDDAIAFAQNMLAKQFGGYTSYQVKGGWINGDGELMQDISLKFEVAFDGGYAAYAYNVDRFQHIAMAAGKAAGQQAVFVTTPNMAGVPLAAIIDL